MVFNKKGGDTYGQYPLLVWEVSSMHTNPPTVSMVRVLWI